MHYCGKTHFNDDHDDLILVAETCSKEGYTWDSTYRICYKYHSTGMTISEVRSTCRDETACLLLLTSDSVYDFAVWFISKCKGSLVIFFNRHVMLNWTIFAKALFVRIYSNNERLFNLKLRTPMPLKPGGL